MMLYLDSVFSTVGVLLSVAFLTIMERKIMALMHYRKGPSKILLVGIFQPIADAMKLLSKESMKLSRGKMILFYSGPLVGIFILLMIWEWYDYMFQNFCSNFKILIILALMGILIYSLLLMSWGSNSKYAILGGHRGVSQAISYEVCMILFILMLIFLSNSYMPYSLSVLQQGLWVGVSFPPLFFVWLLLCLAEANRTPFDTAEGESEIVSGFNIEYGGGLFALIFITEYGMILFMSFFSTMMFLGGTVMMMKVILLSTVIIWARCAFPRVRYDHLMMLSWKLALPLSLSLLVVSLLML